MNNEEEDYYGDDQYLMSNIDGDGVEGEEQIPYEVEYKEVISEMSRLCSVIAHNAKPEFKD